MADPLEIQSKLHNLLIEQSQPFYREIRFKQNGEYISLLPYTFKAQIRKENSITSELISDITCTVNSIEPTKLILKITETSQLKENYHSSVPNNFIYLLPEKLPDNLYHWSLRSFILSVPVSRTLYGLVMITPEVTNL